MKTVNTVPKLYFPRNTEVTVEKLRNILLSNDLITADQYANAFCCLSYGLLERKEFSDVNFLLDLQTIVLKRVDEIEDNYIASRWKSSVCTALLYLHIYNNSSDETFVEMLNQAADITLVKNYPRALVNVMVANLIKIALQINEGQLSVVNESIDFAFHVYQTSINQMSIDTGVYYNSITTEIINATNILNACTLLGFFSGYRLDYKGMDEQKLRLQLKSLLYRPLAGITIHYDSLCKVLPSIIC